MKEHKVEYYQNREKFKMLFSAPYSFFPNWLLDKIKKNFDVTFAFNAPAEALPELLNDKQVWFTGTCPPYYMGKEIINHGNELILMATPSTGTNHIDIKHALSKGLKVLSIKDSPVIENIYASSEFSFTLLLAMVNKLTYAFEEAKKGVWREKEAEFRSIEINKKTIGLIGFGRIGKKMANYCNSFGMEIISYDPFVDIKVDYVKQVHDINKLLNNSDIVSLHYHLNEETKGSFTGKHFEQMKDGAYFLNTARGELVDELAMISALETKKLKAAAVDVISNEHIQNKLNHPVIKYARENNNLIVSPHIAGCTVDSEAKAANDLLDQILEELK